MLENEHVRVWQVCLESGQTQRLHRHDHPYVVVAVNSGINVIHTVDGRQIEAPEPTGHVVYRPSGAVHSLTNVGETRYVSRIIELLDLD
ncbi:MAG: cupin [Actinocatenispora sp.]